VSFQEGVVPEGLFQADFPPIKAGHKLPEAVGVFRPEGKGLLCRKEFQAGQAGTKFRVGVNIGVEPEEIRVAAFSGEGPDTLKGAGSATRMEEEPGFGGP
jgi:hypothetical protein